MTNEFSVRTDRFISEFRFLFGELYPGEDARFQELQALLKSAYQGRSAALRRRDRNVLDNPEWYRRTGPEVRLAEESERFVPYSFTSSLEKAEEFLAEAKAILEIADGGAEVILLGGLSRLFCLPGTEWQHQQKLHRALRLFRIITDTVCPSVLLAGTVPGGSDAAAPYYGSSERPELHLMADTTFLPLLLHTFATADTRLLAHEVNRTQGLPRTQLKLRDLSTEGGVVWTLDYDYLGILKMDEESHREFLNRYYSGKFKKSPAGGRLVKDRKSGTSRIEGTLPELLGEKMQEEKLLLMQALLLEVSGITRERPLPHELLKLRKLFHAFDSDADVWTVSTDNDHVIGIGRYKEGQKLYGLYNFSAEEQIFSLHDPGTYVNLVSGKTSTVNSLVRLQPYAFAWLQEKHDTL